MKCTRLAAALVFSLVAFGACGGDDDADFTEANLAAQLTGADLLEQDVAECVADAVFDELDEDEIETVQDTDFTKKDSDLPPELQEALTSAIQSCLDD